MPAHHATSSKDLVIALAEPRLLLLPAPDRSKAPFWHSNLLSLRPLKRSDHLRIELPPRLLPEFRHGGAVTQCLAVYAV